MSDGGKLQHAAFAACSLGGLRIVLRLGQSSSITEPAGSTAAMYNDPARSDVERSEARAGSTSGLLREINDLNRALVARDRVLARVAHDLRNPVNVASAS